MNTQSEPRNPIIEVGDIVSVKKRSHLVIEGAVYKFKNSKLHLFGKIGHRFKQGEEAYFPLKYEDAISGEDIKDIKILLKANKAIPKMTGTRALKQDELVYTQAGKVACIYGNVKAAYDNIVVVENSDEQLLARSSRLWRRVRETTPFPTTYKLMSQVYRILENGEYIWGEVIGFGEKGRFAIVKMETTTKETKEVSIKYYYGKLDEWKLLN